MDNINVGYYIRQRRIELGLTQVQLAQKIGKALQVNVDYFFPASQKQVDNHPPVMDRRLQYVIKNYPRLTEQSKNIIDAVIRADKKNQKQAQ